MISPAPRDCVTSHLGRRVAAGGIDALPASYGSGANADPTETDWRCMPSSQIARPSQSSDVARVEPTEGRSVERQDAVSWTVDLEIVGLWSHEVSESGPGGERKDRTNMGLLAQLTGPPGATFSSGVGMRRTESGSREWEQSQHTYEVAFLAELGRRILLFRVQVSLRHRPRRHWFDSSTAHPFQKRKVVRRR